MCHQHVYVSGLSPPHMFCSGERSEAICGRVSRFNHRELPCPGAPVGRACVSLTVLIGNFEWSYQVSAREISHQRRESPLSSAGGAGICSLSLHDLLVAAVASTSVCSETYSIYVHRACVELSRLRASGLRGLVPGTQPPASTVHGAEHMFWSLSLLRIHGAAPVAPSLASGRGT